MWSAIASIAGNIASNANINNQISEQKRENQANRDWNLNLARLQNRWNIDQWNRENAYNSPSAQMARYKAAGLNPDLIYGQQNLAAASPEMTSGDGSLPTDVSNLANKRTMLDIVSASLDNDIKREQVKSMKNQNALDSRKVDTEQALSYLTGDILSVENTDLASKLPFRAYQQYLSLVNSAKDSVNKTAENESRLVDLAIKKLDRKFKEESMQTMLEDLSEKLKITKAEAEYYVKTVSLRIQGLKMDNKLKENEDFWTNPGFVQRLGEGLPTIVRLLNLIFRGH